MTGSDLLVRARNEDGTYKADDPSTPDVDEAWTQAENSDTTSTAGGEE